MAEKAHQNLVAGKATLILAPTHDAVDELIGMMPACGGGTYVVHLYGKSEKSCHKDHLRKTCTQCPFYKKVFGKIPDTRNDIADSGWGKILHLPELKVIADEYSVCPKLVSQILATTSHVRVVVATTAYLGTKSALDILEKIHVDEIYLDEADTLFETLLNNQQRTMVLMEPRQKKACAIRERCNEACKGCVPHLADQFKSKVTPSTGRCDDLTGITRLENTRDLFHEAIEKVQSAVDNGAIKPLFDFEKAKQALEAILAVIPPYTAGSSSMDFLRATEKKNRSSLVETVGESEDAEFAIPISVPRIAIGDIGDVTPDDELSDLQMRLAHKRKEVQVDPDARLEKALNEALQVFLYFVDFIDGSSGQVHLFPERRPIGSPYGHERCRLTLRYLNTSHYKRVTAFLSGRSKLLSGTLLSPKLVAANLLLPASQIDLSSIDTKFHRSALIILHSHRSGERPKVEELPPWAFAEIYKRVQEKITNISILHFSTNTTQANSFFVDLMQSPIRSTFKLENQSKESYEHDFSLHQADEDQRTALITVDKLRSSTSRGINRTRYNLCVVQGNGVSNWSDRLTLFMEARKLEPDIAMDDLIRYEQTRAVIQALMRAPRNTDPTVCLYAGNLHRMAFPKFLHNRILTTQDLIDLYLKDTSSSEDPKKLETQINVIAHAIAKFLMGDVFEIARKRVEVANPLALKWIGRRDAFENRMKHIEGKLAQKGFVDRVSDKMGERPQWNGFLDWLVEQGFFRVEIVDGKQRLTRVSG